MTKGGNSKQLDTITKPKKNKGAAADKVSKKDEEIIVDLDIKAPGEKKIYRKVVIYFSIFIATLSLAALITPIFYSIAFDGRVLPGVYVLGEEVGGMTDGELKKLVREKLEDNKFVFKNGDKEETAEFNEMGLGIDFIRLSKRALERGREGDVIEDYAVRYKSLVYFLAPNISNKYFSKIGVILDYGVDREKLDKFVSGLSSTLDSEEMNTGIIIKGNDILVIPAKYGEKVIADTLYDQIQGSIDELRRGEKMVLGVTSENVESYLDDRDLKAAVGEAKEMIDVEIILTYEDKSFVPTKEEIASWIIFEENHSSLDPQIDPASVSNYLSEIAKEVDVEAHARRLRIENDSKEVVEEEGKDGLKLDVASTSAFVKERLEYKRSGNIELVMNTVTAPVETKKVLVADWAKYIEIDLGTQRMTAYENKEPIFSDAITSGKNGFSTPTGTFMVSRKTRSQTMKGFLGTPEAYYLPNVQYISWFNGAIAIHQAYWRDNFGDSSYVWNGSHGCINATFSSAKWIYEWAPIGTPVVVHN